MSSARCHRAAALALFLTLLGSTQSWAESKRIAIVVGNNAGTGAMPPLRFAESDAGKMARVLVELGDVAADDVLLLQGRRVGDLERAISEVKERVAFFERSIDTRSVLLFYFSGHSDGESIEMGSDKLAYARLKAMLAGTGADLRVAIVDACKSGAGFREKGGHPAEPFTIKLTDALVASGEAFISSSAADEAALESSEVMGSYFTHNLISGLRGAADVSGDKLVTLAEAYRYAYDRTVSATSMMPVGAQHPSYDYKLSGQGELVLASLLRPSASLVLPGGAERTLVSDLTRDQVVVELGAGPEREVALAPGIYGIRVIKGGQSFGARFSLVDQTRRTVKWSELTPLSSSTSVAAAAKGGGLETQLTAPVAETQTKSVFSLGFGVMPSVLTGIGMKVMGRASFEPTDDWGFSFSLLTGTAQDPRLRASEGTAQLRAGYRFAWRWNRLWLGVGAEAGPSLFWQYRPSTSTEPELLAGLGVSVSPRATLRVTVYGPLGLTFDAESPFTFLSVESKLQVYWLPTLTAGAALSF